MIICTDQVFLPSDVNICTIGCLNQVLCFAFLDLVQILMVSLGCCVIVNLGESFSHKFAQAN